ncbi:MAG: transglycosylase SLT domain-containing protein [Candidatus Woesearchaeota archaeon]|jgi:hypothetical protein
MTIKEKFEAIRDYRSSKKVQIDRFLDPALFLTFTNAASLYGLDTALNWVAEHSDKHEGLAMLGTYAVLGTGIYELNKHVLIPVAKRIKQYHEIRALRGKDATVLSFGKSGASLAALATLYVVAGFNLTLNDFYWDGDRVIDAFARHKKAEQTIEEAQAIDVTPLSLEERVTLVNETNILENKTSLASSSEIKVESPTEIGNSNKYSTKGRYLRTHRWDKINRAVEQKYGIEEGLLSGLQMRESYGNPLELNSGDDGGAGLMMFQPGTAKVYGLKVYDDAGATGRDRNHGRKLIKLVKDNNYDYEALASIDERFDVLKSADAAGRYLRELYDKYGSWDSALSAYNRGTPATNPKSTRHVKTTREYQRYYLEHNSAGGEKVDETVLTRLRQDRLPEYRFVRTNELGQAVYMYRVEAGDNATVIAETFNRWDGKHGSRYQDVDYTHIVNRDRKYVGHRLHPEQYVYVLAEPLAKSKLKKK